MHRRTSVPSRRSRLASAPAALLTALLLALTACGGGGGHKPSGHGRGAGTKPNVIFVLTDDLSWDLVQYMKNVVQMKQRGLTFNRFFVADSLCCTSRASIFTGRYPHNTGVRTNFPPLGGYGVFKARGDEQLSFAPALRSAGYRTGLMGKYLNGYLPGDTQGGAKPYVPPGWDEWAVAGNGYPEYDYRLNENGKLVQYGHQPQDYLTDVIAGKSVDFVKRAATDKRPFFLEIASFAPHGPFVPAPRHAGLFPNLRAPRTPSFNEADVSDKPGWLRTHPKLRKPGLRGVDNGFRDRARMVQAVDEMIGRLQQTLAEVGRDRDTYVVFGSDNGFHLGQHRLAGGKMTPYDTDIRVPVIVTGPGVPAGRENDALAQNTDFAPTFLDLAGAPVPGGTDGRSLAPFLRGEQPSGWRDVALVEHVKPAPSADDPDRQDSAPGAPPSYNALRLPGALYVEYDTGEKEYYDLTKDPDDLNNLAKSLPEPRARALSALLYALVRCAGPTCATADRTR